VAIARRKASCRSPPWCVGSTPAWATAPGHPQGHPGPRADNDARSLTLLHQRTIHPSEKNATPVRGPVAALRSLHIVHEAIC